VHQRHEFDPDGSVRVWRRLAEINRVEGVRTALRENRERIELDVRRTAGGGAIVVDGTRELDETRIDHRLGVRRMRRDDENRDHEDSVKSAHPTMSSHRTSSSHVWGAVAPGVPARAVQDARPLRRSL
jgi:hypothetical protein